MGDRKYRRLSDMGIDIRALEQWNLQIFGAEVREKSILLEAESGIKSLQIWTQPETTVQNIFYLLEHLAGKGFRRVPRFIRTRYGDPYVKSNQNNFYSLSDWFIGRPLNTGNEKELSQASEQMASLHLASRGFSLPFSSSVSDPFFDWRDELYPVAEAMLELTAGYGFHPVLKAYLRDMADRMLRSLRMLDQSGYETIREKASLEKSFCHGAFDSEHLLLGSEGRLFVSGFEKWRRDIGPWEIARFLIKAAEENGWSVSLITRVIQSYDRVCPLLPAEWELVCAYLLFPMESWLCLAELIQKGTAPESIASKLEINREKELLKEECLSICTGENLG